MRHGEMRERIQLQKPTDTYGKAGSVMREWQDYLGVIKAQLVKEEGGNTEEVGEVFADRVLRFNIHKVAETLMVREGWRVIHDGYPYTVRFVQRYDQRQMLQLTCERVNE